MGSGSVTAVGVDTPAVTSFFLTDVNPGIPSREAGVSRSIAVEK
jgi:hypothetical protein